MVGRIALIGGEEFEPGFEDVHASLVEESGGREACVVFLPTAAANDGPGIAEGWAERAVRHFEDLAARCEPAMILQPGDAYTPEMVELIRRATLIYLGGGRPQVLYETMDGSPVWEAILERHREGVLLAGASAGAMVMGEVTVAPRPRRDMPGISRWVRAFGLLPGIGVIPHLNRFPQWRMEERLAQVPSGITILGIDEQTALVGDGRTWDVVGRGKVEVHREGERAVYLPGNTVEI